MRGHVKDCCSFADVCTCHIENLNCDALAVLRSVGSTATTVQQAKSDQAFKTWLAAGIATYNKNAASNAQQIR